MPRKIKQSSKSSFSWFNLQKERCADLMPRSVFDAGMTKRLNKQRENATDARDAEVWKQYIICKPIAKKCRNIAKKRRNFRQIFYLKEIWSC